MLQLKESQDQGVTSGIVHCGLKLEGSKCVPLIEREFLSDNSRFGDPYP